MKSDLSDKGSEFMIQQCFIVSPKVKDAKEDIGTLHCSKMLNTQSHSNYNLKAIN